MIILYAKLLQCEFHNFSLQFLGVIVASNGISMDLAKCQKVLDWPQLKSVKTLQCFLGFANVCCKFIKNYSKTIINLPSLLQKDTPFLFTEQASKKLDALEKAFTTDLILAHFSELA
ncbi:retrotransposon nucleocapsid protein [Puccinia sorghi]|uniref:Retrotransposon nucleocapsid protein n=1 Tax=Puccinia sorghi TaxID=27349 RepID=A0A0L6U9K8_9BASI|nr:retrotransposon nucleocapsid protein [Puccinia sorghi]